MYSITSYDVATFSVLLEWDNPIADDGLGLSNYTIVLNSSNTLQTNVQQGNTLYLTLLYNQKYDLHIFATNCKGDGPPINVTYIYAGKLASIVMHQVL